MSTKTITKRFHLSRFIKGEKILYKSVKLTHRRIFILPSKRGLGFVALITLLLLIAFVYNNNLAYQLAFLLASIFFITILHSYQSLSALVISQGHSSAVFAGEAIGYEILVDNPSKIDRFNLQAKLESEINFSIAAEQKKRLTLFSDSSIRGWHQLDTITLSSRYPLGLFRAWSPLHFTIKTLVYPKPSRLDLPFPEMDGDQSQMLQNSGTGKGSDDFYELKEYQPGDPIKQIHWKAFAKGQGLLSKQYAGNKQSECCLNYEQTPGHDVEERLSQLCRWIIDAEKAGIKYGLSVPGYQLKPANGEKHYLKCLETLALF